VHLAVFVADDIERSYVNAASAGFTSRELAGVVAFDR